MFPSSSADCAYRFGPFGPALSELCPGRRFRRLLDLGCGDGENTSHLVTVASEVWGVDSDSVLVERAQATIPNCRFVKDSAEAFLRNSTLTFDGVVCSRLIGFIPDLRVLFSVLRARVSECFVLSDWHPLACWVMPDGRIGMDYSAEGKFAPGQYHHSMATIANALIESGFIIEKIVEGPARCADPTYWAAPPAVKGLPLTMTWLCHVTSTGGETGEMG